MKHTYQVTLKSGAKETVECDLMRIEESGAATFWRVNPNAKNPDFLKAYSHGSWRGIDKQ